jgi:hypothetical protein
LQRSDDGVDFNRVRSFLVVGIAPPEADAFAPNAGTPTLTPMPPAQKFIVSRLIVHQIA